MDLKKSALTISATAVGIYSVYMGFRSGVELVKGFNKQRKIHDGTERILTGGIWIDNDNNVYNCYGEKVGRLLLNDI